MSNLGTPSGPALASQAVMDTGGQLESLRSVPSWGSAWCAWLVVFPERDEKPVGHTARLIVFK